MQITMDNSTMAIQDLPMGQGKALIISDNASQITVVVPMPMAVAKEIGTKLACSIAIAASPLPKLGLNGG